VLPHPDAGNPTRRMPFEQLRALVLSLVESDAQRADPEPEPDDDPVAEFETQPTVCLPQARVSTLDQLIAALPRYEQRFSRGSSPCLPRDPRPAVRGAGYTPRPATETSPPSPHPRRPRDPTRPGGGRGSQRR
jgi:hypothetical protein